MTEITGQDLKVGDTVERASCTVGPQGRNQPRPTGGMKGVIVEFNPLGGSGAGRKTGSAKVRWSSGSVGIHDAIMLVKVP